MERVIEHVSEGDSERLDLKKLIMELFDDNVDFEKLYKMIKDTSI